MKYYFQLMRPYQYSKNLFIFAPAFFAFKLDDWETFLYLFIVFVCFCCVCSSVYIINDIFDRKQDRLHPTKRFRPIASGKVSIIKAIILALILLIMGGGGVILSNFSLALPLGFYFFINLAYSLKLKHIPIVDIFIIALGFVIRLFIGGFVIHITLSHWIILITFLLALFLALAKRRDDVLLYEKNGKKTRSVIDGYTRQFVDIAMAVSASLVMVSYILYSVSPDAIQRMHSKNLYLTSIFVLLGIFRYLQLSFVYKRSADPSKVLIQDRFLQIVILCWILSFSIILYFYHD